MTLESAFRRAVADLEEIARSYALVGGFAVSARAEPRLTADVDVAVAVDDDGAAEAVARRFVSVGYVHRASVENEATGRLATVRLHSAADETVFVDLLFASAGIEPEIAAAAEEIEVIPKLIVPVATVGDLIAMKLLARDDRERPNDADDLRQLADIAGAGDWDRAAASVDLIHERGTNRGRDLRAALRDLRGAV